MSALRLATRAVVRSALAVARPSTRAYGGGAAPPTVDQLTQHIVSLLSYNSSLDGKAIQANSHLINDLGLDSLDVVEFVVAVEDEFNVELPDGEAETIFTPKQAAELVSKYHP
ncbi:acyl carrier protein [Salpingoeca rosetta]|uniref:Acyl carrier protein n=1 Tax=Salpingoeca rosetta (strain ATCC 50818 / BSB-021) TaxID=946362 RepID=F2U3B6_SALR5|nr:acyl carrier protein [Salpingoeca rosetta]EGD82110.1 acyl carrier protein [Salpingoeca rosetta]|eukprot:XP_004996293.1 acyl carrier protein [Salpingoeca rosetta]